MRNLSAQSYNPKPNSDRHPGSRRQTDHRDESAWAWQCCRHPSTGTHPRLLPQVLMPIPENNHELLPRLFHITNCPLYLVLRTRRIHGAPRQETVPLHRPPERAAVWSRQRVAQALRRYRRTTAREDVRMMFFWELGHSSLSLVCFASCTSSFYNDSCLLS